MEAVGRDVGLAEAPQVGDDDLEAELGERLDHLPPDALALRPAVHEHERTGAAGVLVDVGLREPAAGTGVRGESVRGDVGHGVTLRAAGARCSTAMALAWSTCGLGTARRARRPCSDQAVVVCGDARTGTGCGLADNFRAARSTWPVSTWERRYGRRKMLTPR